MTLEQQILMKWDQFNGRDLLMSFRKNSDKYKMECIDRLRNNGWLIVRDLPKPNNCGRIERWYIVTDSGKRERERCINQ